MALTTQTMTDEQRKSVALEYLKAFDNVGAATGSSAAGADPVAGTSEKSRPGPATPGPTPAHSVLRVAPAASDSRRTAAAVKRRLLDGGEDRHTLTRREQRPS